MEVGLEQPAQLSLPWASLRFYSRIFFSAMCVACLLWLYVRLNTLPLCSPHKQETVAVDSFREGKIRINCAGKRCSRLLTSLSRASHSTTGDSGG
jgi:hypothetical protein